METQPAFILLYPYPHQTFAFGVALIMLMILSLIAVGLYKLITWPMNEFMKDIFRGILLVSAVLAVLFFFLEITLTLITIHQVNRQLGFCYATPDTPEGEIFVITRVVPGKPMDRAGLKVEDQPDFNNVNEFYLLLINNQSNELTINVLRDKVVKKLLVRIPELDLPLLKVSFLL